MLNEQGFWRLIIAVLMGLGAALISSVLATILESVRRDPKVPITAGISVAATAYAIDWYTERKAQ